MQSCYGHHFLLALEKQIRQDGQRFYAVVQLIGSRKQSENFSYRYTSMPIKSLVYLPF